MRAAITGRRISPPLFESLELLGRDSALTRIAAARGGWDQTEVANRKQRSARSRRPSRSGSPSAPARAAPTPPVVRAADHGQLTGEQGFLPPDGVAYPQVLRGPNYVWWRSVLGVIFGLSLFLLLTTVVSQAVIGITWSLTGGPAPYPEYYAQAFRFERPVGMLAVNLGITTLIPICWVLMAIMHQVRPRWLWSVQAGLRWRYLLICLGIAAVALNGVVLLSTLVEAPARWSPQAGFWGFLVVIILTSPLQAAAEEVFFRGYLMQALGSLVAKPWFGVVVSALVFALLHGTQNLPLFLDRLGFGLLAAVLVWRTGDWSRHRRARHQQRVRVRAGRAHHLDRRDPRHLRDRLGGRRIRRRRVRPVRGPGVPRRSPPAPPDPGPTWFEELGRRCKVSPRARRGPRARHGGVWGNWQPG